MITSPTHFKKALKNTLALSIVFASLVACTSQPSTPKDAAIETQLASPSAQKETANIPEEILGKWRVEYINSYPVIDYSPAYIEFSKEGLVSGNATCNNFTGQFTTTSHNITFSPFASTSKMCGHAIMHQEDKMNRALAQVTSYEYLEDFGFLMLKDDQGNKIFRLVK